MPHYKAPQSPFLSFKTAKRMTVLFSLYKRLILLSYGSGVCTGGVLLTVPLWPPWTDSWLVIWGRGEWVSISNLKGFPYLSNVDVMASGVQPTGKLSPRTRVPVEPKPALNKRKNNIFFPHKTDSGSVNNDLNLVRVEGSLWREAGICDRNEETFAAL